MFIVFVTILAAGLAVLSAHLYTTLTFQAQTVEYTLAVFKREQARDGALAYAIAYLAENPVFQQKIEREREAHLICDIFNNAPITYRAVSQGYSIEIRPYNIKALIMREATPEKVVYSCVAIEHF